VTTNTMTALDLESMVRDESTAYHQRGRALIALNLMEAWKHKHKAFTSYVRTLGLTHNRAAQLVNAARVCDQLTDQGIEVLPETEGVARALAQLNSQDMALVWHYLLALDVPITIEIAKSASEQVRSGKTLQVLTAHDMPVAAYPSDNEYDIPLLLLSGQMRTFSLPYETWGVSRSVGPGTYGFYTDDDRIIRLIADPLSVVNAAPACAIEPNFSVYGQMPRALALGRIYHKRWIARFWQEHGINIMVDLNVARPFAEDNLLGVPLGWRAWATRGYSDRLGDLDFEYALARRHADTDEILFTVYGGGQQVKALARDRGWLHIPEQQDRING